jgi:hypothetical protein
MLCYPKSADPTPTPGLQDNVPPITITPPAANGDGEDDPRQIPASVHVITMPTGYSREGDKPNLDGLTYIVLSKYGNIMTLPEEDFDTYPPVLGYADINIDTPEEAKPITVALRHKDYGIIPGGENIILPGVQALKAGANRETGGDNTTGTTQFGAYNKSAYTARRGADEMKAAVFGNGLNLGVDLVGATGRLDSLVFYQDGDAPNIEAAGVFVKVAYQELRDPVTSAVLLDATPANTWENLSLTQGHLFTYEFNNTFRTGAGTLATGAQKVWYPYGFDYHEKYAYIIISKGTVHGGTGNNTIYVSIPFGNMYYYWIRDVELKNEADLFRDITQFGYPTKQNYSFFLPMDVQDGRDWVQWLIKRGVELTVYYENWGAAIDGVQVTPGLPNTDSLTRYAGDFMRAVRNNAAWIINAPVLDDPDDDLYGQLLFGYYASAWDDIRDPSSVGDFGNFFFVNLPIGTFNENSGQLIKQYRAGERDRDSRFIADGAGGRQMTDSELKQIQRTYDFHGAFQYTPAGGGATIDTVKDIIIAGADFTVSFFPSNPFRGIGRTDIEEGVELEFAVPRARQLTGLLEKYQVYAEAESNPNPTITVVGRDYDQINIQQ